MLTADQKSMQHDLGSAIPAHAQKWWEGVETFVTKGERGGFIYDVTRALM
jgi:hypothetical protein